MKTLSPVDPVLYGATSSTPSAITDADRGRRARPIKVVVCRYNRLIESQTE